MNISANSLLFFVGKHKAARKTGTRIPTRIRQSIEAWLASRRQAREIHDLLHFSDRELWDIGLGRSDIQSIIDGTYRRD